MVNMCGCVVKNVIIVVKCVDNCKESPFSVFFYNC